MGLASATLLERAADEGYLNATVNYQRALQVDDNGVTYEGHAWARVKDENGGVWIADVTIPYAGRLENAPTPDIYLTDEERLQRNAKLEPLIASQRTVFSGINSDGRVEVGYVYSTPDRQFDTTALTNNQKDGIRSFVVETTSGSKYFVGYDPSRRQAFTVKSNELDRGKAAFQFLSGDVPIQVGVPLITSDTRYSSPVRQITAIQRGTIPNIANAGEMVDRVLERFVNDVRTAYLTDKMHLGQVRRPRDVNDCVNRMASVYTEQGHKVNLDQLMSKGSRKAWLHTQDGATFQIERSARGYEMARVSTQGVELLPVQRSLGSAAIGDSFHLTNGRMTGPIEKVSVEDPVLCTGRDVAERGGFRADSQSLQAERSVGNFLQQRDLGISNQVTQPSQGIA